MNKLPRTDKEKITSLKPKDFYIDVVERVNRGERRFFLYWQITKEQAKAMVKCENEIQRGKVIEAWLDDLEWFQSYNLNSLD
jgi:hypothetical protein